MASPTSSKGVTSLFHGGYDMASPTSSKGATSPSYLMGATSWRHLNFKWHDDKNLSNHMIRELQLGLDFLHKFKFCNPLWRLIKRTPKLSCKGLLPWMKSEFWEVIFSSTLVPNLFSIPLSIFLLLCIFNPPSNQVARKDHEGNQSSITKLSHLSKFHILFCFPSSLLHS